MGIWTGIKQAINKTLGTKDFMSLDEIIRNQYRLVPDDNVYEQLANLTISGAEGKNEKQYPKKIKILNPSTLRIAGNVYRATPIATSFTFSIIKNNAVVYEFSKGESDYNTDDYKNSYFETDVICDFGDVVYFKIEMSYSGGSTGSVELQDFAIKGHVVNNIYTEVIE